MTTTRKNEVGIINTRGEHPPNKKGELLCNGHCNWDECAQDWFICTNCGYIDCSVCCVVGGQQYYEFKNWDISDYDPDLIPCRNCGKLKSAIEYYEEEELI